jgi:hypothetical protein
MRRRSPWQTGSGSSEGQLQLFENPSQLTFTPRFMTWVSLPYRDNRGKHYPDLGCYGMSRTFGGSRFIMMTPEEAGGLPYGNVPRLLISWLANEAVLKRSRAVEIGGITDFVRQIGLKTSGGQRGPMTRVREQAVRLFTSQISHTTIDVARGVAAKLPGELIEASELAWHPGNPDDVRSWRGAIHLTQDFFEELIERPIPIDFHHMAALRRSSMALDVYVWLCYRIKGLRSPLTVRWEALKVQFGIEYKQTPRFKFAFKENLRHVLGVWPEFRIEETEVGITLKPSQVPIKEKRYRAA